LTLLFFPVISSLGQTLLRCWVVCVGLVLLAACGQAQKPVAPPPGMPESVRALLSDLTELCRGGGGTPHAENAVRRADLNDDGQEEYILFAGWIHCENAISMFEREIILAVFADDGHGNTSEAFRNFVFDAELENVNGAPELWLTTRAEQCGRPSAATFAEETFCRRAVVSDGMGKFDYAPVATVRFIE
jgi:hypothetical protein